MPFSAIALKKLEERVDDLEKLDEQLDRLEGDLEHRINWANERIDSLVSELGRVRSTANNAERRADEAINRVDDVERRSR